MRFRLMVTPITFSVFLFFIETNATVITVPGQYPTVQQGINASSAGDTVLIANGLYSENISIVNHDLVLASDFIFSGDLFDIAVTVIDGNDLNSVLVIGSNANMHIKVIGLSFTNGLGLGSWPNVHGGGIHVEDGLVADIDHCFFYENVTSGTSNRGAGIYIQASNSRISNCAFWNNESRFGPAIAVGNDVHDTVIDSCIAFGNVCTDTIPSNLSVISIAYSNGIIVSHCQIFNNNGTGIRNWGSYITQVNNCTISNNGGYGINNTYYNSDIEVTNTISAHNAMMSMFNSDQYNSSANAEYSDMMNATGMPWFGTGCIDADPMFSDTSANDYSLLPGSPCIDAGDPSTSHDPDGTIADMGAIYYHQTTALDGGIELPGEFALIGNYPNPFNGSTTIRYSLSSENPVRLSVYSVTGQRIAVLVDQTMTAGIHDVTWNAGDIPSGVYFARIESIGHSQNLKMVLLK